MQKLLGKKKFEEILGSLVEKPQGKPVLVPESDKRKPFGTAKDDFRKIEGGKNMPNNVKNPTKVITGPETRWS